MSRQPVRLNDLIDTSSKCEVYFRLRYHQIIEHFKANSIPIDKASIDTTLRQISEKEGIILLDNLGDILDTEYTFHEKSGFRVQANVLKDRVSGLFPGVISKEFTAALNKNTMTKLFESLRTSYYETEEDPRGVMPTMPAEVETKEALDIDDLSNKLHEFCERSIDDLIHFVGMALYQGFNRPLVTQEVFRMFGYQAIFVLSTIVGLRGPVKCYQDEAIGRISLTLSDGTQSNIRDCIAAKRILNEKSRMGGKLRPSDVTMGRINACFPDLAAYGLLQLSSANMIGKRIQDNDLPAFLQFPQAASLPMTEKGRRLHVEFSKSFSKLIGGTFNPSIYNQQAGNVLPIAGNIANILIGESDGCLCDFSNNVSTITETTSEGDATSKPKEPSRSGPPDSGSKDAK